MPANILVVDDDELIQSFCKTVLEGAGFRVETCGAVKEALESVRSDPPDLLILDIRLPDGNGMEVCRAIRKAGSDAPVLFLTANRDLKTRLECFQLGAQDYLQKPFSIEELLARVKVHLGIKKSHDELIKRNYELELKNRLRQDLTDMIVHDLRAPLTSIHGTLELIKMRGLISDKDYGRLLDCAGTAAEFMILMLNDLLDISQAEQAQLEPQVDAVEVKPLMEKMTELFATKCQRLDKRLEIRVADDVRALKTDPSLLFRIIVNLISNALGIAPKGTAVELECVRKGAAAPSGSGARLAVGDGASQGAAVRFSVLDRGPGVPDREKSGIFEKYHSAKGGGNIFEQGRGIGLTFCRLATEVLKGRIWVEDREGGGSRFIFESPDFTRER
ncbi:MAG: response regulator [Elusimicrobia bacterium]|nr:response regulator [Elusimicrobiota bacterium]